MNGLKKVFAKIGAEAARVAKKKKRRHAYKEMLRQEDTKEKFTAIYEKNFWGSDESSSGRGSEFEYTEKIRNWLQDYIKDNDVRTLVDAPCGDFNWMQHVLSHVDIHYFGYDIVDSVVKENSEKHCAKNTKFAVADITQDELEPCDILMVRDCLFHLSYSDINKFLKNISTQQYKYLLTTTHLVDDTFENSNITTGDYRKISLFRPPFNFDESAVLDRIDDFPEGHKSPREMILVKKQHVPVSMQL